MNNLFFESFNLLKIDKLNIHYTIIFKQINQILPSRFHSIFMKKNRVTIDE